MLQQNRQSDFQVQILSSQDLLKQKLKLHFECSESEEMVNLGSELFQCTNLTVLKFSFHESCELGQESISALFSGIVNCKNLTSLSFHVQQSGFDDESASAFVSGLAQCKNLTCLKLVFVENLMSDEGISVIGSGLAKCTNLTFLNLVLQSDFSLKGFSTFASGLVQCEKITTLKLRLYQCDLEVVSVFTTNFTKIANLTHLTLDLEEIDVGDNIVSLLGSELGKCSKFLNSLKLDLSHGEGINSEGISNFFSGLRKCENLTNLNVDLTRNVLKNEDVSALVSGITKCVKLSSLALNLSDSNLNAQSLSILISGIPRNIISLNLDMSWCQQIFERDNSSELRLELLNSTNLTSLTLGLSRVTSLDDLGISVVSSMITKCVNLTSLELLLVNNPNISAQGISNLCLGITKCRNLTSLNLNLQKNKFCDKSISALGTGLAQMVNLTKLVLKLIENPIKLEGLTNLCSQLTKCTRLNSLTLHIEQKNIY